MFLAVFLALLNEGAEHALSCVFGALAVVTTPGAGTATLLGWLSCLFLNCKV